MKRTLLGLTSVALLTLSACGTPVAEAGTAPAPPTVTGSTPSSPATTPTTPEATVVPPRTDPALPLPFGASVTNADDVTFSVDEPEGYGDDKEPVTLIRVHVFNGSAKAFDMGGLTLYPMHEGKPVSDIPLIKRKGELKKGLLPPAASHTIEMYATQPLTGVWEMEVTAVDDLGEEVPWARFSSDADAWSATTEMHLKTPRPRSGTGIPLWSE